VGNGASAIICTRNRSDALRNALKSVSNLDLAGIDFELIVVDNGSSDDTAAFVRDFAATAAFPVKYVYEAKPGLSAARNAGIGAASGDVLLFTDDDCVVAPDWVKAAVKILSPDARRIIGGRIELYNSAHIPLTIKTSPIREELRDAALVRGFIHGANFAFGRSVADRIGLFDTRLGAGSTFRSAEDMDFAYRARRSGIPVSYEPEVLVHHNHGRTNETDWYDLMYGYSMGNGATMMKHLLLGRTDLAKTVYWEFVRIFNREPKDRAITTYLHLWLIGIGSALRFLLLASWRPPVR